MNKTTIVWGIMIAFIGLGLGITIGRNADPFKIGQSDIEKNTTAMDSQSDQKIPQDSNPSQNEYDLQFINAMIEHHESAITMATEAKEKSRKEDIIKMSDDIIKAQSREIEHLKLWREEWYGNR